MSKKETIELLELRRKDFMQIAMDYLKEGEMEKYRYWKGMSNGVQDALSIIESDEVAKEIKEDYDSIHYGE